MHIRTIVGFGLLALMFVGVQACSSDEGSSSSPGGSSGASGSAGTAGSGGTSAAGSGGTAGSGGSAGTAGSGGTGVAGSGGTAGSGGSPQAGNVVGAEGVAAFDGLSNSEKAKVGATKTFFLHQSVGENIVDGAASLGFDFEWVESGSDYGGTILGERVTDAQNKDPLGKLGDFDRFMIANEIGAQAKLAGLKFCYSDLSQDTDMNAVRTKYAETISKIESAYPNVRLYMTTPPIHQVQEDWLLEEENKIRLDFGQWLVDTYSSNHIIYDLAAVENTREDGTTCTYGSVKVLCSEYWDGSSGSHLNATGQVRAAKGFLFALHRAGTL